MGEAHTKTPALPPDVRCRHSHSKMKFSYCFTVRRAPIGAPVQVSTPSLTPQVSGAQFTFTHPLRSLPLKIGVKPSSSAARAGVTKTKARNGEMRMEEWCGYTERCREGTPNSARLS